jgi:uncharacterized membrane protein
MLPNVSPFLPLRVALWQYHTAYLRRFISAGNTSTSVRKSLTEWSLHVSIQALAAHLGLTDVRLLSALATSLSAVPAIVEQSSENEVSPSRMR